MEKELEQQIERDCFEPIHKQDLTSAEYRNAIGSLAFLAEKHDGVIKARHCANGSEQRDIMHKEDASSPTVSTEAVLITSVIDAEEDRESNILSIKDNNMGKELVSNLNAKTYKLDTAEEMNLLQKLRGYAK